MDPDGAERPARQETPEERADRNWIELLQELRVSQTGAQLLAGFLMTLPFQSRFEMLDSYQVGLYVVLGHTAGVVTAVVALVALFGLMVVLPRVAIRE